MFLSLLRAFVVHLYRIHTYFLKKPMKRTGRKRIKRRWKSCMRIWIHDSCLRWLPRLFVLGFYCWSSDRGNLNYNKYVQLYSAWSPLIWSDSNQIVPLPFNPILRLNASVWIFSLLGIGHLERRTACNLAACILREHTCKEKFLAMPMLHNPCEKGIIWIDTFVYVLHRMKNTL